MNAINFSERKEDNDAESNYSMAPSDDSGNNKSAVSFHKEVSTPKRTGPLWLIFEAIEEHFGPKTIVIYVFIGPICLVISAALYQAINLTFNISSGEAIFFRSFIFLVIVSLLSIKEKR